MRPQSECKAPTCCEWSPIIRKECRVHDGNPLPHVPGFLCCLAHQNPAFFTGGAALHVTVDYGLFFVIPIELEVGISVVVFLFGRDVPRFVVVGHEAHVHVAVDDGVGVVEGLAV